MSNAQRFCDALAARRWFTSNWPDQEIPVELDDEHIKARYAAFVKAVDDDSTRITFLDDSVAVRDGVWQVVP